MKAADVDYARDFFTDLVSAWTTRTLTVPPPSESRALADRALNMARVFSAVKDRTLLAPQATGQKPLPPDAPALTTVGVTFAQVVKEWVERIVKRSAHNSKRSLISRFERYVIPHLGTKPVAEVKSGEILSVLRSIAEAGYSAMAYQTFKDLRFMYRYALVAGLTNRDPTATLRRAINKPRSKGTRMLLDPQAIGRLLLAIRQYKGKPRSTAKFMLQLAPMVFLRSSELRTLEWKDVDLYAATIVIPASRMKSGRPHVVPLARQAVRLLQDVQRMTGYGRYVFNGGRSVDQPLDYSIFYVMLRAMGYRKVVTPHGFRVLASTWLNEQGWRADVIERQLSHLGADRTRRLYNRAEYMPERRRMMQAWADELERWEYKTRSASSAPRLHKSS